MQAFTVWHGLLQQYSKQPLLPPVVCSIVEDMALALPDVAQGEAPWSPLDNDVESDGKAITRVLISSSNAQCSMPCLHNTLKQCHAPVGKDQNPYSSKSLS